MPSGRQIRRFRAAQGTEISARFTRVIPHALRVLERTSDENTLAEG